MLALEVTFLTGRYVATEYNDRSRAEWPPHPARLFSALVAAHASDPIPEEREALQWLERQDPPEIAASSASEREVVTVYVPVNDTAGVEEGREKQPRMFPSRTPEDPRVVVVWPKADTGIPRRAALDRLCEKVIRIGHSSSFACVRVVDVAPATTWRPSERGRYLRVIREGQLDLLDQAFDPKREPESGRVMPAAFQRYTDREPPLEEAIPQSEFSEEWLVLRRAGRPGEAGLPAVSGPSVAGSIRRALLRFSPQQPAPEILSGHARPGEPTDRTHAAIVPLPFVGHEHADGRILGVAIVLPRATSEEERRSAYRALAAWENAAGRGGEEIPEIMVHTERAGSLRFQRIGDDDQRINLHAQAWCVPSTTWFSATPMALDQNPGDLHSRDPKVAAKAIAEAEEIVRRACERIALPRPVEVTILPAAPLAGAAKARAYGGFPSKSGRAQRVLTHVRLCFETDVRGPILIGAGRYSGLGLLRPVVG